MRRCAGRQAIVLVFFMALGLPATAAAAGAAASPHPYASARTCSACHQAIHKYWSESPHALSASNPVFLETLRRGVETAADKTAARRECVWCHAPTTLVTNDFELKDPVSREGITCDFCHTVADVDMDQQDRPFVTEPGPVKRGPLEYAKSPAHKTAYSPLHRASPLLCAACHEWKNTHGVAVLSTYSEWKAGPYPARGVPCQDCHMGLVPGATVREDIKGTSLRVVNLHRLVGGSARSQLARGLDLKIESMTRSGEMADIAVSVTNVAAGHPVPGGLATKSLVLAVGVEAADGTLQHRQERVYRREMKDAQGKVLEDLNAIFAQATSIGIDNRIKPKESRTERFSLPISPGARALVARLEYRDASDPRGGPKTLLVTETKRDLAPR
ncbi:MAG TPA: multiheme c-type cytochrome [Candidatus Polarisedimenticolia bacterium]|nr:multiheme c-type cytochrome [Candidatus Polarisedimenticolia bacterium]